MHGGKARQVKARREQRVLLFEAQQRAAPPVVEPEPELSADEILIGLLRDVRRTFEHVKAGLVSNSDPSQLATWLAVMGDWADRLDRISRSTIITNAEARVTQRKAAVTETQVAQLSTFVYLAVTEADLSAGQKVAVMDTLLGAVLRADEIPVLSQDTLARWLAQTRTEAARESEPELLELEA
jgi:hypothetical protein